MQAISHNDTRKESHAKSGINFVHIFHGWVQFNFRFLWILFGQWWVLSMGRNINWTLKFLHGVKVKDRQRICQEMEKILLVC